MTHFSYWLSAWMPHMLCSRKNLPTDSCNCHRLSSVSGHCWSGHGVYRIESIPFPTSFLEEICYDYSYWPAPDRRISSALEQHWAIHFVHCWDWKRKHYGQIIRSENGSLETTVYRKATRTGRYLNFKSYCPRNHWEAIVRALFKRAETHCSNVILRAEEECKIMAALSIIIQNSLLRMCGRRWQDQALKHNHIQAKKKNHA